MESNVQGPLVGCEIHGFRTMQDLDIPNIMEESKMRWLRPNEIHAMLCNHKYFNINVKPVNLPKSGTIVLFDRKMLRNFRRDGHNWKKKKDGKTVKEAHEHLKVGNEERIHVYYAHGQDNPTFVRRCYWLLDKTLEHIVLVHYRETQEGSSNNTVAHSSPAAPVNSGSSLSDPADLSSSWVLSGGPDLTVDRQYSTSQHAHLEPNRDTTVQNHEQRLLEINTLEWDELLAPGDPNKIIANQQAGGTTAYMQHTPYEQHNLCELSGYSLNGVSSSLERMSTVNNSNEITVQTVDGQMTSSFQKNESGVMTVSTGDSFDSVNKDGLQTQDSFGRWMNYLIADSPESTDDPTPESLVSTGQSYAREQIFNITEISPAWALSTEETKIVVIGHFHGGQSHLESSSLHCVCGDSCFPAEVLQPGVYRCVVSPQTPGLVNMYLSFDGNKPISQVMSFEFRAPSVHVWPDSPENKFSWDEFRIQMRLAHLLFSTSKSLNILSSKIHQDLLKDAKTFAGKCSHIIDDWACLIKSIEDKKLSVPCAKDYLFELSLRTRLQEWLLERIVDGCEIAEHDEQGQGVIHLCAILGYTWAVYPYSWSGLSLDYRDKYGWTALHWAAYHGREKMVATLLSAGAKPNLVTDSTSENLGGCTASDVASKNGHEGLGAYLAEKALVAQFKDMTLAGNISGSLQTTTESINPRNFTDEELNLKDSLSAYRTAADAAARIQAAFRERSLKARTKAVESSNPEMEARNIIAAMKIQHAFRNYEMQKQLAAAARIQYRFRTWKMRKEFLHMRRQAIKIQAVFRGFQVRRQYRKIIWSVGVLEKALFRWRLKRKGFRGLKLQSSQVVNNKPDDVEEDFFQASRKQAEERIERSVVRVQSMFRSKQAQEQYRRMKLEHNKATLEYEGTLDPDTKME
ncbi:calmodulin-binding transcription activator 6 isoform X1 [Lycium ferocissimum]|uniref:calmodulin-binding transcription activator 6 isoform X1 n=1 Tax=Lycium ferocissimum TaxID=112874 RepID=UPI0028153C26|nr:calmodulin-binding transcription activator 6 isoform X1 [Lycium ferocissimum]